MGAISRPVLVGIRFSFHDTDQKIVLLFLVTFYCRQKGPYNIQNLWAHPNKSVNFVDATIVAFV